MYGDNEMDDGLEAPLNPSLNLARTSPKVL